MTSKTHHTTHFEGKNYGTHRLVFMWEHKLTSIPSDMHVHHLCGNKACLNVDHMVLLTRGEHTSLHNKNNKYTKGKPNPPQSRPVAQIHPEHGLIKIWPSMTEADRNGFNKADISKVCQGSLDTSFDCWWMKVKGEE